MPNDYLKTVNYIFLEERYKTKSNNNVQQKETGQSA